MAKSILSEKDRRVLRCLSDDKRRSLPEITPEYNKRYPPAFGLFPKKETHVRVFVRNLERLGFLGSDILWYTTEVIPQTKFFSITTIGFHELHCRR